ncbi:MAG: hypothetical protein ACPG3Z_07490 [Saprospiraceae bacterium]
MSKLFKHSLLFCSLLLLWSCSSENENTTEKPLATVFDKSLYPSDIEGIVGTGINAKDSSMLVNSFIENWAKEQLIIAIAEQNIPDDLDVDRLVEDYRLSLIRHSYEQKLVEQRLDSMVTDTEIRRYYESALDQYQLDKTVVQGKFIKLPKEAPEQDTLKLWWKNPVENKQNLAEYCRIYADKFLVEDSVWIDVDYLAAEFPISSLKEGSISGGLNTTISSDEFVYYIKVDKVVRQGQIAPLSYVKNKIIKVILRKRKFELLDNMTDELYKRELDKKNVVISNY